MGIMSGYVQENLMPGERVVYEAKLHKIIYLPSITVALLGIPFLFFTPTASVAALFWGVGLIAAVAAWIKYRSSEFAITDKRVIIKTGLLQRDTLELFLSKAESIRVEQDIFGRIFNYGSIAISGTGGSISPFHNISAPIAFKKHMQEQAGIAQKL